MTDTTGPNAESQRQVMVRHLQELVAALEARTPHLERTGEIEIASEAAALKEKALKRLAELGAGGAR